ncbi:hypothetical protein ACE7GA_11570 [Roseomonas sp. CCTCC AB2023176]|uniref:hypothetical protein n=1 Tax=Roseomonas sp. CCTCC AB2023176 TaxID=3342640 RepID=UPI0035DE8B4E
MFDAASPVPALSPAVCSAEAGERRYAMRYVLLAEPSPGLLPRMLQFLAKRDLTPDLFRARRLGPMLRTEIAVEADEDTANRIAGDLRRVVGVARLEVERGRVVKGAS